MTGHVNEFAAEIFREPEESFNFMLSLAEQIMKDGNRKHAAALGRHLAEFIERPIVTARVWTRF